MLPLLASMLVLQSSGELKPLDRMAKALKGCKAVSFTLIGGLKDRPERSKIRLLAQGSFSVVSEGYQLWSDGSKAWLVSPKQKTWKTVSREQMLVGFASIPGFGLILSGSAKTYAEGAAKEEEFLGERVVAVPVVKPEGSPEDYRLTVLLDPKTWLPRGFMSYRRDKPYETFRFEDVKLDPPLKTADFRFVPPKGFKRVAAK